MVMSSMVSRGRSFYGRQGEFSFPTGSNPTVRSHGGRSYASYSLSSSNVPARRRTESRLSGMRAGYAESNSADSSTAMESGYYSFANISDNTTSEKAKSNRYSYLSSSDSSFSGRQGGGSTKATSESCRVSPIMGPILENLVQAVSPVEDGKPEVGDASSLYVSPLLAPRQSISRSTSLVYRNHGSIKYSPTMSSLGSMPTKVSSLKRSNAVRCRGGLLQFFSECATRSRRKLHKWKLAIRKKLFRFRRSKQPKKKMYKMPTTSHLKRTNGYVSNIRRSVSSRSGLGRIPDLSPMRSNSPFLTLEREDSKRLINSSKSIRRSPSSIKRAATTLRINVPGTGAATIIPQARSTEESNTSVRRPQRSRIPRSSASTSLSSIARQSPNANNNQVFPAPTITENPHFKFSRPEALENKELSNQLCNYDYTADSQNMLATISEARVSSLFAENDAFSFETDSESSADSSLFQDTLQFLPNGGVDSYEEKLENARAVWNHFLKSIIAARIKSRLDFLNSNDDLYLDDNSSNVQSSEELETTASSIITEDSPVNEDMFSETFNRFAAKFSNSSHLNSITSSSNLMFALPSAIAGVRRSLTMPVGLTCL